MAWMENNGSECSITDCGTTAIIACCAFFDDEPIILRFCDEHKALLLETLLGDPH